MERTLKVLTHHCVHHPSTVYHLVNIYTERTLTHPMNLLLRLLLLYVLMHHRMDR
jgi:hypothetical protein